MKRVIRGMMAALAIATAGGTGATADTLRGVILAEDGTPAADAKVWAIRTHGDGPPERRDGIADAAGRFAFEVGEGSWALGASLGDQGPDLPLTYLPPTRPTTIRLKRQGRLRVRLVEAETARPIAGARLALDNGLELTADADGRLEVRGLSRDGNFDGRGLARAGHHEASAWAPGRECKLVLFAMGDGPTTDLEIALPRGGRAVGRVLDEAGRPIAGATVAPSRWGGIIMVGGHLIVRTESEGRFEFDGLPIDQDSSLSADAPGHVFDIQHDGLRPAPDGTAAVVEFQLAKQRPPRKQVRARVAPLPPAPTRAVTGLVVGVDRKPVAATVTYDDQEARDRPEAKTDAAGRFRLAGVPDQAATVTVVPDRPDLAPEIAAVAAGGDEDLVVVTPPGWTATGVVHDDRGTPFAGVEVAPRVAEGKIHLVTRTAVTDAAGRFAVTGLPDSPTNLAFDGPGMVPTTLEPARLDADNDVTMTALGAFAGRVVAANGQPVRNFRVLIRLPRGPRMDDSAMFPDGFDGVGLTVTTEDGSFRVRNLLPGSIARITILAPGYAAATIEPIVAVPDNQLDPAMAPVFRLGPPRMLRVHAIAARTRATIGDARVMLVGAPIGPDDFRWSWWGYDWADTAHTRTDARGIATFDPLSYDEAVVLVEAPGFARRHVRWLDGAADLEVALEPEGVIEGAILDEATGGPLGGISISLISPENGQLGITPRFGGGGRFRFGELPAGTYQVFVETAFGALHQEQVVLKPGEYASRTLRLKMPATLAPPPG